MTTPDPLREGLIEQACEVMHDAYESAAIGAGWVTQERSRVHWVNVPEANQQTMRVAVSALIGWLAETAPAVEEPHVICGDLARPGPTRCQLDLGHDGWHSGGGGKVSWSPATAPAPRETASVEVTDAMVERAALAYEPHGHHSRCAGGNPCDCYFQSDRRRSRAALVAALTSEES